jgi:hypothetical protein
VPSGERAERILVHLQHQARQHAQRQAAALVQLDRVQGEPGGISSHARIELMLGMAGQTKGILVHRAEHAMVGSIRPVRSDVRAEIRTAAEIRGKTGLAPALLFRRA